MMQDVKGKVIGGDIDDTSAENEAESESESREPLTSQTQRNYGSFWGRFKKGDTVEP